MATAPRQWVYRPRPASHVPDAVKNEITAEADKVVETLFKPRYVQPPPKKPRFNYIVDIYTKWHKNCLCFCAKFACPGPNALSPFFEDRFTRVAYMANGRFNLVYMRHTGKWCEVFTDLSLAEAFASVRDHPFFHPPG